MFKELWCAGATRRYWWALAILAVTYVPTLLFALSTMKSIESPAWRALAALTPLPFLLAGVYLEYVRIRRTDELRQRMELEAGLLALVVSVVVVMALGLLDDAGVIELPLLFAPPVMCVAYVGAQVWAHRHYQ